MLRKAVFAFFFCLLAAAQERIDADVNARIRREAMENSQILRTVHYLTDVHGPRLTGSPQFRAAAEWAAGRLAEWGLDNARLEAWDFGRDGWSNERVAAFLTSPVKDTLVGETLAWTPGTEGAVTAECAWLTPPVNPSQEELSAWLGGYAGNVRGKIVLVGAHTAVPVNFSPPALRLDQALLERAAAEPLTPLQVSNQVDRFLRDNGALVRVNDSALPLGQVRALQNRTYDVTSAPPTLVLRGEDYGRITRLMADGLRVEMEVQISSRIHPEGRTSFNVLADIPGAGLPGEWVMLGGHIDAWHIATGATDNASGAAVMMEAARILKVIGVEMRRSIRVALWGGEEQGLLGSQAHVRMNYGTAESPRADFARLSAYLNLDSGTGRIRRLSVFGPPAAAAVLDQLVAPFAEWGVGATRTYQSRASGGSDHTSFSAAGLPGISLVQDPIEYNTATWHTNLDTYERILEGDLKQAAVVVASVAYHLAVRDSLLPRFGPGQMPPPLAASETPAPR